MSKVQTRRSISFARADYEQAQTLADRLNVPLAQLAAQALRELAVRNPDAAERTPRSIADQVVIDDLEQTSPFRRPCLLAGCGAVPGQACRPVPLKEGGTDPELATERAHANRLWQVQQPTVTFTPPPIDSIELAAALQRQIDERVGVLPRAAERRASFTLDDARCIVAEVSDPGYQAPALNPEDPIDRALAASSVGFGLRNIEENGLDAELEDLEHDLADHPDAGEVRVVYDEDAP